MAPSKITAREIMQPIRLALTPSTSLTEVRDLLIQHRVSGAPVIDDRGELVGVISQSDLVRTVVGDLLEPESEGLLELFCDHASTSDPLSGKTVAELMTKSVLKASPTDTASFIAKTMIGHHVHRIIVVDGNRPVGIISSTDLIALIAD